MGNILRSQDDASSQVLRHLSQNVRVLRAAKRLSQAELSARAGVSRRMITGIESGSANISLATVDRLASALEVSFSALVRDPRSQDSREVRVIAWTGQQAGSEGVLLGAAPAGGEVEMWIWRLAAGEAYASEAGSEAWHEMIFVLDGTLAIMHDAETWTLGPSDFRVFSSAAPYAFVNQTDGPVRFLRNVALAVPFTFKAVD